MSQTKKQPQNEILDAAFAALGRGWPVFPISVESKNPMVAWKRFQSELPSKVKVSNWFDCDYKGQANLGLATGELSRIVVLDCDDAIGLEEIERRGGMPDTVTVQTRPDIAHKLHFYFEHPGFDCQNFAKKFKVGDDELVELPGLDFRGDGGYVMLPPSRHWSGAGQYEWLRAPGDFPIAPLPEWLHELLELRHQYATAPRPVVVPVPLPSDSTADRARKWALGALQKERDKMLAEPDGSKHERRRNSAHALGGIAVHGLLTDAEIFDALAVNFGKDRKNAEQTIRDGIKAGREKPRSLPSFEDRRARPRQTAPPDDHLAEEQAVQGDFDTRSLEERGVSRDTQAFFHIAHVVRSNHRYSDYACYEYPTFSANGRMKRSRQFVIDPAKTGGKRYLSPTEGEAFAPAYNLPEAANQLREGALDVWVTDSELSTWHMHQAGVCAVNMFSLRASAGGMVKELVKMGARRIQICTGNSPDGAHAALQILAVAKKSELPAIARALPGPEGFTLADLRERCVDDAAFAKALSGLSAVSEERLSSVLPPTETQPESIKEPKTDKAEQLLDLLEQLPGMELFHTDEDEAFISLPRGDWRETYSIKEEKFGVFCRHYFHKTTNRIADSGIIENTLGVLDGRARFERPQQRVHVRSAQFEDRVYIDLCDEEWNVVEIGENVPGGWQIIQKPPVHFRRARGMEPLPKPVRGGKWNRLRDLVNVGNDHNWIMLVSWLVMSLRPADFPYPVLAVHGEQETGKTTLCKVARRLIDPNFTHLLNAAAIDRRDLYITAKNSFVVGFDNMSKMSVDVNDALCSLVTEGSFRTRKLRTDQEEVLFKARRPVVLNGINENLGQNDLRRRCVKLFLEPMGKQKRDEEEVWSDFHALYPQLLGLLCDAICVAMTYLPSIELEQRFGLLDFRRWIEAAEPALPWKRGEFAPAYRSNLLDNIEAANDADPFTLTLIEYINQRGPFRGTPEELREGLERFASDIARRDPTWPKSAQMFGTLINRVSPNLSAVGIQIKRTKANGRRILKVRKRDGVFGDGPPEDDEEPTLKGLESVEESK